MATVLIAIISAAAAVFASTGFWAYITRRSERDTAEKKLLMGLAHDRLISQCVRYTNRGYITQEEYDDLKTYLYLPYKEKGGNSTVDKMIAEVDHLPMETVTNIGQLKKDLYKLELKDFKGDE